MAPDIEFDTFCITSKKVEKHWSRMGFKIKRVYLPTVNKMYLFTFFVLDLQKVYFWKTEETIQRNLEDDDFLQTGSWLFLEIIRSGDRWAGPETRRGEEERRRNVRRCQVLKKNYLIIINNQPLVNYLRKLIILHSWLKLSFQKTWL